MLVEDRLGHACGGGDVVHCRGVITGTREYLQSNVEQLLASLVRREASGHQIHVTNW